MVRRLSSMLAGKKGKRIEPLRIPRPDYLKKKRAKPKGAVAAVLDIAGKLKPPRR